MFESIVGPLIYANPRLSICSMCIYTYVQAQWPLAVVFQQRQCYRWQVRFETSVCYEMRLFRYSCSVAQVSVYTHALHYIILHYISCITLHYITLHSITLHLIALHCITLHCTHRYIHAYIHPSIHPSIHASIHACIHTYIH